MEQGDEGRWWGNSWVEAHLFHQDHALISVILGLAVFTGRNIQWRDVLHFQQSE